MKKGAEKGKEKRRDLEREICFVVFFLFSVVLSLEEFLLVISLWSDCPVPA